MHSPSFTRYSSGTLEDIAARVVAEFSDSYDDDNVFYLDDEDSSRNTNPENNNKEEEEEEEEDDNKEFEFPSHVAPVEPLVFPIFGRNLINKSIPRNRNPLWKLMNDERETRETATSCSSSESDDLDGVPEETYCVWNPAAAGHGKSNSVGSSKRWKIRDLLFRSNSDGKGSFVIRSSHAAVIGGGRGGVRTGKIS